MIVKLMAIDIQAKFGFEENLMSEIRVLKVLLLIVLIVTNSVQALLDAKLA